MCGLLKYGVYHSRFFWVLKFPWRIQLLGKSGAVSFTRLIVFSRRFQYLFFVHYSSYFNYNMVWVISFPVLSLWRFVYFFPYGSVFLWFLELFFCGLVKIWSLPVTWDSFPSSMHISHRFDPFVVSESSWIFL